jgi:hypothetical protein
VKIAFKLPLAEELAAALCAMPDKDAGAAFKAALIYRASGEVPMLSPTAKLAFTAMRELIDLSRMKAAAGRAGGRTEHFYGSRKYAPAGSSAGGIEGNTGGDSADDHDGSIVGNNDASSAPDILAGLAAFL